MDLPRRKLLFVFLIYRSDLFFVFCIVLNGRLSYFFPPTNKNYFIEVEEEFVWAVFVRVCMWGGTLRVCVCVVGGVWVWGRMVWGSSRDSPVLMILSLDHLGQPGPDVCLSGRQDKGQSVRKEEEKKRVEQEESRKSGNDPLERHIDHSFHLSVRRSGQHNRAARWWQWPRWRPRRCTMVTATKRSTCCRRMNGTGTCCWIPPGSNSSGK